MSWTGIEPWLLQLLMTGAPEKASPCIYFRERRQRKSPVPQYERLFGPSANMYTTVVCTHAHPAEVHIQPMYPPV